MSDIIPTTTTDPQFIFPPDDPRYQEVAKYLAVGCSAIEATINAEFDLPSGQTLDENYDLTEEDHSFSIALTSFPPVRQLHDAIIRNTETAFAMPVEEKRAFLRAGIMTPIGAITKDSPFCQEYEKTETHMPNGRLQIKTKVKKIDILRAMDMDAKLAGDYAAEKVDHSSEGLRDLLSNIREKAASKRIN